MVDGVPYDAISNINADGSYVYDANGEMVYEWTNRGGGASMGRPFSLSRRLHYCSAWRAGPRTVLRKSLGERETGSTVNSGML